MLRFEPLDPGFPVALQVDIDDALVMTTSLCTVAAPVDEQALLDAWAEDSRFMKCQPRFISTQPHRSIDDSPIYLNYAIFDKSSGGTTI